MRVLQYVLLVLICIQANVVQGKTHVFIIPSLLIFNLKVTYDKAADAAASCTNTNLTDKTMWLPDLSDINSLVQFSQDFDPALTPNGPTCWYHLMQLAYEAGRFKDNVGASVTPFAGPIYNVTGYLNLTDVIKSVTKLTDSDITPLPYDWRLDLNSMDSQLKEMAKVISAKAKSINDKVILVGHSLGCIVALKLLKDESVRSVTKAFFSFGGPYGGAPTAIAPLTSGTIKQFTPPDLAASLDLPTIPGVTLTIEQLIYNAAKGMASLALLAPTRRAFRNDPVLVTVGKKTYKLSQLVDLYRDLGQDNLVDAFSATSPLQTLVESVAGPANRIKGVDIYCIYGSSVNTPTSFTYENISSFTKNQQAPQPTTANTSPGDAVVPLESLSQCNRLTTSDKVIRLRGDVNHFTVLYEKSAMARFRAALRKVTQP